MVISLGHGSMQNSNTIVILILVLINDNEINHLTILYVEWVLQILILSFEYKLFSNHKTLYRANCEKLQTVCDFFSNTETCIFVFGFIILTQIYFYI